MEIPIPAAQINRPSQVNYDPVEDRIYWLDSNMVGDDVLRSALLSGMDARDDVNFDGK